MRRVSCDQKELFNKKHFLVASNVYTKKSFSFEILILSTELIPPTPTTTSAQQQQQQQTGSSDRTIFRANQCGNRSGNAGGENRGGRGGRSFFRRSSETDPFDMTYCSS